MMNMLAAHFHEARAGARDEYGVVCGDVECPLASSTETASLDKLNDPAAQHPKKVVVLTPFGSKCTVSLSNLGCNSVLVLVEKWMGMTFSFDSMYTSLLDCSTLMTSPVFLHVDTVTMIFCIHIVSGVA